MSDLIKEAIDGWKDETEREATGTVEGHDIKLVKREYEMNQRGPTAWEVGVFVDDDGPLATNRKKKLEADEAQRLFDRLVETHNLTEV